MSPAPNFQTTPGTFATHKKTIQGKLNLNGRESTGFEYDKRQRLDEAGATSDLIGSAIFANRLAMGINNSIGNAWRDQPSVWCIILADTLLLGRGHVRLIVRVYVALFVTTLVSVSLPSLSLLPYAMRRSGSNRRCKHTHTQKYNKYRSILIRGKGYARDWYGSATWGP